MFKDKYLNAVYAIAQHLDTHTEGIDAAALAIADALSNGNALVAAEVGHANQHDWVSRAGGLAAIRHFSFSFSVNDALPTKLMGRPRVGNDVGMQVDLENVRHAVRVSRLRAGDVLLVGSVSGRSRIPVELAIACREKGVKVVGFTSFAYTKDAVPLHPTGKRLIDVVDFPIDLGAPYGDAAVKLDGYDWPLLPVSGAGAIMAGWMIFERVMENLAARGTPAAVFMSYNRAGGEKALQEAKDFCDARGY